MLTLFNKQKEINLKLNQMRTLIQQNEIESIAKKLNLSVVEVIDILDSVGYDLDEDEILSIYNDYKVDNKTCVCCSCRMSSEAELVVDAEQTYFDPADTHLECSKCGEEYEVEKPTLKEWLFITG